MNWCPEYVVEVLDNTMYYIEARTLTEKEKAVIIRIYNEILELNDCPTLDDINEVWELLNHAIDEGLT